MTKQVRDHRSLPEPVSRRAMHTRRIQCDGYVRDDGLWDIEARIVDTKHYRYTETYRGLRNPDDTVHDMQVRLTVDDTLTVREVAVAMPSTPYQSCTKAAAAFDGLVGSRIGGGWRAAVNKCVGGTLGCTHVRELLFPMATVAFQTVLGWPEDDPPTDKPGLTAQPVTSGKRPHFIDGCYAWSADGDVVADQFPAFSTRDQSAD